MVGVAVLTAGQIVLSLTFALSAAGKAFNSRSFEDGLASAGFPLPLISPATAVIVILEASLSFAIVLTHDNVLGFPLMTASLVLALFTAWLIWLYRSHKGQACGCFGSATDTIGIRSLIRNILLIALSLGALVAWSSGSSTMLPSISWVTVAIDLGIALILLLVACWNGARRYLAWSVAAVGRPNSTEDTRRGAFE